MRSFPWFLALVSLVLLAAPARALEEIYTGRFSSLAVGGYDAVAYFTEGRPIEGSSNHKHEWKGATWRFASAENLAKFVADPMAFAPQYGGYCAYAVAYGGTAPGDPQVWKVVNGKLYLNVNSSIGEKWEKDIPGYVARADVNWPKLLAAD